MRYLAFAGVAFASALLTACGNAGPTPPSNEGAAQPAATAIWSLDPASSHIAFLSIKAGDLIEVHRFPGLSGSVDADGNAEVSIPLDQVDTKIEIRDERMRSLFFETEQFPTATFRALVDKAAFADLSIGERTQTEIEGSLALHGEELTIYADVSVTRIADAKVEIASIEPVVIYVSDFGLEAGLEALRDIAGLPSITDSSPVSFSLIFEADV